MTCSSTGSTSCRSPGTATNMRIVVDVERCRGAGLCALTAPEVFDQDEQDGTVIVRDDETTARASPRRRRGSPVVPQLRHPAGGDLRAADGATSTFQSRMALAAYARFRGANGVRQITVTARSAATEKPRLRRYGIEHRALGGAVGEPKPSTMASNCCATSRANEPWPPSWRHRIRPHRRAAIATVPTSCA